MTVGHVFHNTHGKEEENVFFSSLSEGTLS